MKRSLILCLFLVSPFVAASNTLWNIDEKTGLYSFWIYSAEGGCPDLRDKSLPLVFRAQAESGTFQVQELISCLAIVNSSTNPVVDCKTGNVQLEYDKATNTYVGKYHIVMADDKILAGNINAEFCAEDKR